MLINGQGTEDLDLSRLAAHRPTSDHLSSMSGGAIADTPKHSLVPRFISQRDK